MSESMPNPDINNQILAAMGDEEALQRQLDVENYINSRPTNFDEVVNMPKPEDIVIEAPENSKDAYKDLSYAEIVAEFTAARSSHIEKVQTISKNGKVIARNKTIEADPTKASDLLESLANKLADTNLSDDGLLMALLHLNEKAKLTDSEISTLIDDIDYARELKQAEQDLADAQDEAVPDNDDPEPTEPNPEPTPPINPVLVSLFDQDDDESVNFDGDEPIELPNIIVSDDEASREEPLEEIVDAEIIDEEEAEGHDTEEGAEAIDTRFYNADGTVKGYETEDGKKIKSLDANLSGEVMRVVAEGNYERFYHLYLVAADLINTNEEFDDNTKANLISQLNAQFQASIPLVNKNKQERELLESNLANTDKSDKQKDKWRNKRRFAAYVEYKKLKVEGVNTRAAERLKATQRLGARTGRIALKLSGLLKSDS